MGLILGLLLLLGFLFLGPRQMHALIRQVANSKKQFDAATGIFKSQVEVEHDASLSKSTPSHGSPPA